jgi:hypothetical protein
MSATDFGSADQVIHIPARDLRGTRDDKLAALDLLLVQLQVDGAVDAGGQPPRAAGAGASAGEDL